MVFPYLITQKSLFILLFAGNKDCFYGIFYFQPPGGGFQFFHYAYTPLESKSLQLPIKKYSKQSIVRYNAMHKSDISARLRQHNQAYNINPAISVKTAIQCTLSSNRVPSMGMKKRTRNRICRKSGSKTILFPTLFQQKNAPNGKIKYKRVIKSIIYLFFRFQGSKSSSGTFCIRRFNVSIEVSSKKFPFSST